MQEEEWGGQETSPDILLCWKSLKLTFQFLLDTDLFTHLLIIILIKKESGVIKETQKTLF